METNEMPMTSNVAVAVNATGRTDEHISFEREVAQKADHNESDNNTETGIEKQEIPDRILHSAKEDGFEEVLEKLANGEFEDTGDEDPFDPAIEISLEKSDKTEGEEPANENQEIKEAEIADDEPISEEAEKNELVARIRELESQITGLEERNKDLFEQVKYMKEANTMAMQTIYEMTQILQKLIDEEEDDEKKISLMDALIMMMTDLMRAMFVPGEEDALDKAAQSSRKQKESPKKGGRKGDIGQLLQMMKEKGLIKDEPVPEKTDTPKPQEKMAQAA